MRIMLKLLVMLALLAGVLWWPSAIAEASNCCSRDCYDAYFIMQDNHLRKDQSDQFLKECLSNCDEHGDPSACVPPPAN
jgi:hypothetical protein